MPTDPFPLLRAMAEHAGAFAGGRAQAEAAAAAIFAAAVKAADGAGLAAICDAVGGGAFDALAAGLKPAEVRAAVDRVEGAAKPARTPAAALASLGRIARGIAAPPALDLAALDLAGLRQARAALGDGFEAWLAKQGPKVRPALQALDPLLPKVSTASPARARLRLAELAQGAEPTRPRAATAEAPPALRLGDLDVDGIRRARAALGDRFMPWLEAQKLADLRAALARIDKLRPNVKKLPRDHYPFLLAEIAAGGALYTTDEDSPPIGQEVFSMREG